MTLFFPSIQENCQTKLSSAAGFMKKLHDLAVTKKDYMDLQEVSWESNASHYYGSTFPKDSNCNLPCSWASADPTSFLIRGDNYLTDQRKVSFLIFFWFFGTK